MEYGIVVAVGSSADHTFSKSTGTEITLLEGLGVRGDAHCGVTVKHRSRVARDPTQPNLRQVHLMHAELFDELAAKGFDVLAGQMGENITTRGIPLLALPEGTELHVGECGGGAPHRVAQSLHATRQVQARSDVGGAGSRRRRPTDPQSRRHERGHRRRRGAVRRRDPRRAAGRSASRAGAGMTQHIGIVACSAEGAALCYRTICAEGARAVRLARASGSVDALAFVRAITWIASTAAT